MRVESRMSRTPPPELRWFNTAYVAAEDRLRLACALKSGGSEIVWLTRRISDALIRQLLDWLDRVTPSDSRVGDLAHRMAQQAAMAKTQPRPVGTIPDAPGWVARSVGYNLAARGVMLTFLGDGGRAVRVQFDADHLRRWLKVLQVQYRRSGWPLDLWPAWIREEETEPGQVPSEMLH